LPIKHIMKEVEINLRAGKQPLLHAEDVLRYKANGFTVNQEAVIDLFKQVSGYPGVEHVGMSHFALSSVADAPEVVEGISIMLEARDDEWLAGQTGIETASPRLIEDNMRGKCKPFKPEDWPQVVVDSFQILSDNHWIPCATLIIGLPGEDEKDVQMTIDLIGELEEYKSLILPLFFVSEGKLDGLQSFNVKDMTRKQCELMLRCWEHSLNWTGPLLEEYFRMTDMNSIGTFGAKKIFAYALRQSRKLVKMCEDDYDYNLQRMLQDARNGEITMLPKPLQTIYNYLVQ